MIPRICSELDVQKSMYIMLYTRVIYNAFDLKISVNLQCDSTMMATGHWLPHRQAAKMFFRHPYTSSKFDKKRTKSQF